MPIEEAMAALTAALNANTLAHGGKAAGAGKPAATSGKAAAAAANKITAEMVRAAVIGVKDAYDKPTALALIKKHAKVSEISAIKPSFYQAVIDACAEKMGEGDSSEETADDDDEL